jgi:serine/threonine/tyrosine protein kinase RAD53
MCCERTSDATLILDLVLEYIDGGDLLDFLLAPNGFSESIGQHITRQMCSGLSVRPNTYGSLLPTLTSHACSMSTKRASPTAISSSRYAVSAEFAPPIPLSDNTQFRSRMCPTKDDPPIVKVADFGLAKAVDSFTMLRVRSFGRCLIEQHTIPNLYRADDVWDAQLSRA